MRSERSAARSSRIHIKQFRYGSQADARLCARIRASHACMCVCVNLNLLSGLRAVRTWPPGRALGVYKAQQCRLSHLINEICIYLGVCVALIGVCAQYSPIIHTMRRFCVIYWPYQPTYTTHTRSYQCEMNTFGEVIDNRDCIHFDKTSPALRRASRNKAIMCGVLVPSVQSFRIHAEVRRVWRRGDWLAGGRFSSA